MTAIRNIARKSLSKSLVLSLLFLVIPRTLCAAPIIERVSCSVNYQLRDGSESRGALEQMQCVLRVGLNDYVSSGTQWRFFPEKFFGCTLEEGQEECEFTEAELDYFNEVITGAHFSPRLVGLDYRDRSDIERKYGCVQVSLADENVSPFIVPTPAEPTGNQEGKKCADNQPCSITIRYEYECTSLPEPTPEPTPAPGPSPSPTPQPTPKPSPSPTVVPTPTPSPVNTEAGIQCRSNYLACLNENIRFQLQLGQCRGTAAVVVSLGDFSGGVNECEDHLSACRTNNFQLVNAISICQD